jgi:hypothetical protein
MAKIILFLFTAVLFTQNISGQKTPAEFGQTAFFCFQHNKMDSLFKTIPSLAEISVFARELGIVQGTDAYSAFVAKYPLVVKGFRDKCYQIEADSVAYKFSWTRAHQDKIELTEKLMHTNSTPSKEVQFTVVNIYFSSGGQNFLLKFGDLHKYGSVWKPGNDVSLTIRYD